MEYRIFQLEEEINRNLKSDWTVEKMAEICELSKDYFHKLFKDVKNQTPIQYLKELRLEKSKELLETKKCKVKEILYEVGINDQTHFVRDFKKKYGMKPNEYRRKHWEDVQAKLKMAKNGVNG